MAITAGNDICNFNPPFLQYYSKMKCATEKKAWYGYICARCKRLYKNKKCYIDHQRICGKNPTVPCINTVKGCKIKFHTKHRAKWHVTKECEFREELQTKRESEDDGDKLKLGEVRLPFSDSEIIPAGTVTETSDDIMKQIMNDIFGDTSDIDKVSSPCQDNELAGGSTPVMDEIPIMSNGMETTFLLEAVNNNINNQTGSVYEPMDEDDEVAAVVHDGNDGVGFSNQDTPEEYVPETTEQNKPPPPKVIPLESGEQIIEDPRLYRRRLREIDLVTSTTNETKVTEKSSSNNNRKESQRLVEYVERVITVAVDGVKTIKEYVWRYESGDTEE
jgi:hypothetical protein